MTEKAVAQIEEKVTDLSVTLTDHAMAALKEQRRQLSIFIKDQLQKGSDFDKIPGTPKECLLKPGAEKLANIFKLGSRIVDKTEVVDHDKNFIMCTYRIEIFHIPTGLAISQCEGSANSKEKKYKNREPFDMINTFQKMAQKRAYVGAVIIATGASDFFTQDLDDMDLGEVKPAQANQESKPPPAPPAVHGQLSEKQIKRLFAIAHSKKLTDVQLKGLLKSKFNLDSTKNLSRVQYDSLIAEIELGAS